MVLRPGRVVVDANVVVGELTKRPVLEYIAAGHVTYFLTQRQRSEAEHEVLKRLLVAQERGVIDPSMVSVFLGNIDIALSGFVLVPDGVYADMLTLAAQHVLIDPDDRPTAALALALGCGIWTSDKAAFWGCGLPIWTFETLGRVHPAPGV